MSNFHYLARALILENGYVLTVREKGSELHFLPGGHIEFGEGAKVALKREIMEETGLECSIGGFVGALEHSWPENVFNHHEINLIFYVNLFGVRAPENPVSLENHLEFNWLDLADVSKTNLQPYPLREVVLDSVKGGVWKSTLE